MAQTDTTPKKTRLTVKSIDKIKRIVVEHLKADALQKKARLVTESYRDQLRDEILPKYGITDVDGHEWIIFEEPVTFEDTKPITAIKRQVAITRGFDAEAAEELIKERFSAKDQRKYIKKVVYYEVDEDALAALAYDADSPIKAEEIEELYTEERVTHSYIKYTKDISVEDLQVAEDGD